MMTDSPKPLTWLLAVVGFALLPFFLSLAGNLMPDTFASSNSFDGARSAAAVESVALDDPDTTKGGN